MKHILILILSLGLLTACAAAPSGEETGQPNLEPEKTEVPQGAPYPAPQDGNIDQSEPSPYPAPNQHPPADDGAVEPLLPLREDLAARLDLRMEDVALLQMEEMMWSDGCLGAALPGEMCTLAIVPGYIVVLETPRGNFEYHTDQSMRTFRLATPLSEIEGSQDLLVTWIRTGGFAGVCQEMTVTMDGIYQIRDCHSDASLAKGMLPTSDWETLLAMANSMAAHEWTFSPPPGSADMFIDQYTWHGTGSLMPDKLAQEALNEVLAKLAMRLMAEAQNNAAEINSGIQGVAMIGPACPGPVQVDNPECADKPYQAMVIILDITGKFVERFQTGEDGRFRVQLEPGMYTLKPESLDRLPTANEQLVQVIAGQFTEVSIPYDSGIR